MKYNKVRPKGEDTFRLRDRVEPSQNVIVKLSFEKAKPSTVWNIIEETTGCKSVHQRPNQSANNITMIVLIG